MAKTSPKIVNTDKPMTVFGIEADRDYLMSRWISFVGSGFAGRAGFFAHQACEKYMKALLVQETKRYIESHELLLLADECGKHSPFFLEKETKKLLTIFDAFDQVGRYGAAAKYDPHAQKTPQFETAGVMVWQGNYRNLLDRFVFASRALLDWSKVNFRDQLDAILKRDRSASFMQTWEGRPPQGVAAVIAGNARILHADLGRPPAPTCRPDQGKSVL